MRKACEDLAKEGYGGNEKLHEVYLPRTELLLTNVKQYRLKCTSYENKFETLLHVCQSISEVSERVIIIPFGNKDTGTGKFEEMDKIFDFLRDNNLRKVDFSASSRKNPNRGKRIKVTDAEKEEKMRKFKAGETRYMIATTMDRGINIIECTHVILFGMAEIQHWQGDAVVEDEYLQRIGRCGREGKDGCSIILYSTLEEEKKINEVEEKLKMKDHPDPDMKQGIKEASSLSIPSPWNGSEEKLTAIKDGPWQEEFGVTR